MSSAVSHLIHSENESAIHAKQFGVDAGAKRAPLGNIGNFKSVAVPKKDAVCFDEAATKPAKKGLSLHASASEAGRALRMKRTRKGSASQIALNNKRAVMDQGQAPMEVNSDGDDELDAVCIPSLAFAASALPPGVEDIDAEDVDNPLQVAEYVNEIYHYMRQLELKFQVPDNYLDGQPEINTKMRSILVDWLVDVHFRFELLQETLFLTINVMDRYLSKVPVSRTKLQLVAVTAMLVASKYEEMYPPEVKDMIYICDNAYTRQEVLQMEQHMLYTLDFSFGNPLALHFLRRNSKAGKSDMRIHTIAKYLMELTLGSYSMLRHTPSMIAASGLYLARIIAGEAQAWEDTLEHYSGYTAEMVHPCAVEIAQLLKEARMPDAPQAIRNKYARTKFMKISQLPEVDLFEF